MTQMRFCWQLIVGFVLLALPQHSSAEQNQHPALARRDAKTKAARRLSRKKLRKKTRVAPSSSHPFSLRVLYTPSYRFFTKQVRDGLEAINNIGAVTMDIAQFFPIAAGLEAEIAFNKRISLAVWGNFSWRDKFITYKYADSAVQDPDLSA